MGMVLVRVRLMERGLGVLPHVNVRRTPRHWYHVSVLPQSHCMILMQVQADRKHYIMTAGLI